MVQSLALLLAMSVGCFGLGGWLLARPKLTDSMRQFDRSAAAHAILGCGFYGLLMAMFICTMWQNVR